MDFKKIRVYENLHIVMWLLKDTCWIMDWRVIGMIMVAPTILLAFFISWKSRSVKSELFHNLAVSSWIMANSTWMTGEFFYNDTTRPYAAVFFALGFVFIIWYYGSLVFRKKVLEK